MTFEIIIALFIFTVASTSTPGPNNVMLLASGMNYGVVRTLPHMLGIAIGFPVLVLLSGIGLSTIFETIPYSYDTLKVLCTIFLFYLAWKIATASKPEVVEGETAGKPLTFLQAALFQWVNPKAWTISISMVTVYAPKDPTVLSVIIITFVAFLATIPSTSIWTFLGHKLRSLVTNERYLRIFNITCAILLVVMLLPVILS